MSQFKPAMDVLWSHEAAPKGSSFVNDPDDRGGATNYGLTLGWLKDTVDPAFTVERLKSMTPVEACILYEEYWWKRLGWEQINDQTIATKIFDGAVNMGTSQMVKLAQRALCDCGTTVSVDGILGPKTVEAINATSVEVLLPNLVEQMCAFYRRLVVTGKRHPKWLKGDLKRSSWPGRYP